MVEYESIVSAQSLLAVLFSIFIGIYITKIGETRALIILVIIYLFAFIGFILGTKQNSLIILILTRPFMGLSNETLNNVGRLILLYWFEKQEIALIYSFQFCFQKLGASTASMLIPYI